MCEDPICGQGYLWEVQCQTCFSREHPRQVDLKHVDKKLYEAMCAADVKRKATAAKLEYGGWRAAYDRKQAERKAKHAQERSERLAALEDLLAGVPLTYITPPGVDQLAYRIVLRRRLWEAFDGLCGICREYLALHEAHIDHIVPQSRGGGHDWANLQPCHKRCNSSKGARLVDEYQTEMSA